MYPDKIKPFESWGLDLGFTLYGVFIALGILACFLVFYFYTKKMKMPEKVQDFGFINAVVAILIGFLFAKLYQAFYNYLETGYFDFYSSGITVMGGIIGGALTFILGYFVVGKFVFKRKEKNLHLKEFPKILQVAPACIAVAHAFGRLGCLMAGCCHGKYLGSEYVVGGIYMRGGYYVPTQLYEALFLFALFVVLSLLYFRRSNLCMSVYLIAYGIWRIFIEFLRTDNRGAFVLGLSPSQWQSFLFIILGVALILIYKIRKKPWSFDID